MILTLLLFLVVLSVLVLVHEVGHFFAARRLGMKVEEFGIGFPPRLFKIRRGETVYSFNVIPLGGFVKIKGESGEASDEADSFASHPARHRFVVLIAGVFMNMVLAAVLLGIGFWIGLPSILSEDLPSSARVRNERVSVIRVLPQSAAEEAGVKPGDTILSINDRVFASSVEAHAFIKETAGSLAVVVERTNGQQQFTLTAREVSGAEGTVVGVALADTGLVSYAPLEALGRGVTAAGTLAVDVLSAFWQLIRSLFGGPSIAGEVTGPVGIAVLTGEAARMGIPYLLQFAAVLSVNLAIINVLPFPALDGGRILFLFLEKLRGRRVTAKLEALVHNFGFLLLLLLVIFVTVRDVRQFGGAVVDAVKSIF